MVINKVLDEVFSTWSNIAVLRSLNNYIIGLSGREVSRIAGLSPKNCLITLSALENLGLVNRIRGGREHLFSLNRNNFLVSEAIIPLLKTEEKYYEGIINYIKNKLKKKFVSIYLFGSVARKDEIVNSDLDLCFIYNKKQNIKQLQFQITELQAYLFKKYNVNISPIMYSRNQFKLGIEKKKSPISEILNEGILISGFKWNGVTK